MAIVYIAGTRGIPNRYGGFERLVEVLAPNLVERGHDVTVFCESSTEQECDLWRGVRRCHVVSRARGPLRTLQYDFSSVLQIPRHSVVLLFGYGTALFQLRLRALRIPHAVNMDGIEWQRAKWGPFARVWLRLNEYIAAKASDVLISDHPEIQKILARRLGVDSRMIAYGAYQGPRSEVQGGHPAEHYLGRPFFLVIARPEPENQVHVVLEAYRASKSAIPLLIIGDFDSTTYGRTLKAQNPGVDFAGPVYDAAVLDRLRSGSTLYLHGHSVGGTNPSLIEAMAAGAPIAAHDNVFNRWVAGDSAIYFTDSADLSGHLANPPAEPLRSELSRAAVAASATRFNWDHVLDAYAGLVEDLAARALTPGLTRTDGTPTRP
jgi:glycosyltransferase involved in cell wall biosynthesis